MIIHDVPNSSALYRTSSRISLSIGGSVKNHKNSSIIHVRKTGVSSTCCRLMLIRRLFAAYCAVLVSSAARADAIQAPQQEQQYNWEAQEETLANIPQTLSAEESCASPSAKDCKKARRIQRPKSSKAESCTIKCVTTCIRGGDGSPGEGPLNIRRPLVVFRQGFRSRQYCLVECSDICNLIGDGDDGP